VSTTFLFRFGLAIAVISGAAALSHELLWTRRLVDLLGGSSEANTRVLSLFFLGLAIGAVLAQRWLPRIRRPWLVAGIVELGIAGLAVPALALPLLTDWLWPLLGPEQLMGWAGRIVKFAISVLVVVPPAIAMGVTLPLFVSGCLQLRGVIGREGLWIYAANTCGGLLGLMVMGGVILPMAGSLTAMRLAIGLNGGLAAGCFLLQVLVRRHPDPDVSSLTSKSLNVKGFEQGLNEGHQDGFLNGLPSLPNQGSRTALGVAFASGLGLLAAEIVTLQAIMLVVPLSFFGPLAVLATVVGLLAVAAPATAAILERSGRGVEWWLSRLLLVSGVAAVFSPIWYLYLVTLPQMAMGPQATVLGFAIKVVVLVAIAFGPLFFLLGMVFPMSLVLYEQSIGSPARFRWPILLAANGIGGLLGAELAYRLLMPLAGVHGGLALVGLGYLSAAALVVYRTQPRPVHPLWVTGAAILGIALFSGKVIGLPQINPFLPFDILSERVGADGLVAVVEGEGPGRAILVSNQYILGSTSGAARNRRQAHLPLMLHGNPEAVGFVGLATGITPGAALRHSTVRTVSVAEISRSVVDAADQYFDQSNDSVTRSDRVRLAVVDGRTLVAASPDHFDVLVGDLFLPWGAGASRLFSIEHFTAAKASLRTGGVFCQWLPMYQLTEDQFWAVCHTFQLVFPTAHLFRNDADPLSPSVALVGFRDSELSWPVVKQRCEQAAAEDRLRDPSMMHWEAVAMHYIGSLSPIPESKPLVTLDNMWIEIDASRQQVSGNPNEKYLTGPRWIEFLADAIDSTVQLSSQAEVQRWQKVGFQTVQWQWRRLVASARKEVWQDAEIRARLVQRLPSDLLDSIRRYPEAWPGDIALFEP
jgi:spermidine synthase